MNPQLRVRGRDLIPPSGAPGAHETAPGLPAEHANARRGKLAAGSSRAILAALAAGAAGVCFAARAMAVEAPPASSPVSAKRVTLLNGRDLAGWKIFLSDPAADTKSVWSVDNGVLKLTGKPTGYAYTEQSFTNYRLHVEWLWPAGGAPKGNSGVFVHLHGPDAIWPNSVECQLASGNAGQLIGNAVDLPGAPVSNKKPRAPKLAPSSEKPPGEWNSYDIVCRGSTIDVTVNGVHQNHVENCSVSAGRIGVQLEGFPIEFRNLWLEPL